jgi:FkbM family methyltransferase
MYRILALIGRNWPFSRGTGWLVDRPSRLIRKWPSNVRIRLKDGRVFEGDLNDRVFCSLYLYGTYEPLLTTALRQLVRPGDTVVDVGANVGIVTALLGLLVGSTGQVFSFEPVPPLFDILRRTISLNNLDKVVTAANFAIGDRSHNDQVIYRPKNHSHACSSLRVQDFTEVILYRCRMLSLDEVTFIQGVPSLVKVDAEGAEILVLRGAEGWCTATRPPIWVLEVNHRTAEHFGYRPRDLVDWLAERRYTGFFWSDRRSGQAIEPGVNFPGEGTVYCLPSWAIEENRIPRSILGELRQ